MAETLRSDYSFIIDYHNVDDRYVDESVRVKHRGFCLFISYLAQFWYYMTIFPFEELFIAFLFVKFFFVKLEKKNSSLDGLVRP